MNRIDNHPNYCIKAMVHGATRMYGVNALSPRLAKRHLIYALRKRGITGFIKIVSVTKRGNPNLVGKVA